MGNRPNRNLFVGLGFTARLTKHRRIGYYIYPDLLCGLCSDGKESDSAVLVTFVVDQLLVATPLASDPTFNKELSKYAGPTGVHVFDPETSGVADADNVQIWRLHGEHASGKQKHADVAEAVWDLRTKLPTGMEPEMVAPNHVLVPAGKMHECPWGPPSEHGPVPLPPRVGNAIEVVVIDSGFIMQSPVSMVVTNVTFGEWLVQVPAAAAPTYVWEPGTEAPPGVLNALDQNEDGMLDALAGHANFVAGVVAQGCDNAELTVESLNSSVIDGDTSIPGFVTEAEVARCMWEHRNAPVMNVGFAFATLPDVPLSVESDPGVVNGPSSFTLRTVMNAIAENEAGVVVAPAGNQNCVVRQYPAAFSLTYENVAGVGSVDASGNRSTFSNHGSWVNCCAVGEDVASAFVDSWDGPTEEGDPDPVLPEVDWPHPDKSFHGWASWSGTSFAAPKVAAAIAELVASGAAVTPVEAWEQLSAGGATPDLDMGKRLDGLPPI
jgi:hypothetical protein